MASEDVAMLLLLFFEEFKGVGTKLQGTAQVWKEPIFKWWLTLLPTKHKQKLSFKLHINNSSPGLSGMKNTDVRLCVMKKQMKKKNPK